jgi:hypothetical protein
MGPQEAARQGDEKVIVVRRRPQVTEISRPQKCFQNNADEPRLLGVEALDRGTRWVRFGLGCLLGNSFVFNTMKPATSSKMGSFRISCLDFCGK